MGKRGPKPRSTTNADQRVTVRVTKAERRAWLQAAGDQPLADWVRDLCNRAARNSP
jgi:hypothetical protein